MFRKIFKFRKKKGINLELDEIFLDSHNLPSFDKHQFEGVIEKPISQKVVFFILSAFVFVLLIFSFRAYELQVAQGDSLKELSENNNLRNTTIFAERGVIYDRNNVELAWNSPKRTYVDSEGFSHLLGYVSYPQKDEIENYGYHPKEFVGRDGVEKSFNDILRGKNGLKIEEVDVLGNIQSQGVIDEPKDGENVILSIDKRIQEQLFNNIKALTKEKGFSGGSGVIMDVNTGEIIALVSYPEYSSQVMSDATDRSLISSYQTNPNKPFLNRAIGGQYTPGSIIKPFIASAALQEGIIDPNKIIKTTGALYVPNPYFPGQFTIFRDWKNHGDINMYDAIAFSSNVYFFEVGGGFEDQKGLGIDRIDKYSHMFGFGEKTGINLPGEMPGLVPNRKWKQEVFGEEWRIGDTYNTSIGQYNYEVTPIQMARAVASIANGGKLFEPTLTKGGSNKYSTISISPENLNIVKRGMREAVTRGSAKGLSVPQVQVAAKTGTAEIDFGKKYVNSWVEGFFPYEKPRYSFAVVMEKGARGNYIGGVFVVRQLLDWMAENTPEYFTN